jgi:riboflavin synthase
VFTGIVEACVAVSGFQRVGGGARLLLPSPGADWQVAPGESLSVSGCCLTVVQVERGELAFDLSAETSSKTWFGELEPGRRVNLERALRLSDRLGGHLVSGHVDGVGRATLVRDSGDGGRWIELELPAGLERYLIEKGSITLDGVSLTVVAPRGRRFGVALIPETLARTTLGELRAGQAVHVEADLIGKWIERLMPPQR